MGGLIVKTVKQSASQSIYIVCNDSDIPVGRLNVKKFVTAEEAMTMARKFAEANQHLFWKSEDTKNE